MYKIQPAMRVRTVLFYLIWTALLALSACKQDDPVDLPPFGIASTSFDGDIRQAPRGLELRPVITVRFTRAIDQATVEGGVKIQGYNGQYEVSSGDSSITIRPLSDLKYLTRYLLEVGITVKSADRQSLDNIAYLEFYTRMDDSDKLPRISDDALMDSVQRRTFTYFWDFAHPVSGLARERNTSGDLVTSGGSGFGLMAIPVAIGRGFITREEGLLRSVRIVDFLLHKAERFHGAYPHWLSGSTGSAIPFSANDNGADLVETSYLIAGLLTLREYFDRPDPAEQQLRADIDTIWHGVEWDWFRRNGQNVLYWHWSPDKDWIMNHQIAGWNECLITYILAACSPTHPITSEVYHNGWARNGGIRNNKPAYGINLPLGGGTGGPLFFEHYTFLGIDPFGLKDQYAGYEEQTRAHTLINRAHCIANPRSYYGYSAECWGLTAGDVYNGYTASSPDNDVSVITPTAALSSIPYTPQESLDAMRFFYYKLGDKLWGPMGFYDGFSLHRAWFATSTLAIDQGPVIVMIENYRTQMIWKLMMNALEIRTGMTALGFESPYFN